MSPSPSADVLRPPAPGDPTAAAYKDWLHLYVFDAATGACGVVNASLHGAPGDGRSRAVGTALLHLPGTGWAGNMEIAAVREARLGLSSIALANVALAIDASGTVLASARFPDDGFSLAVTARPSLPRLAFEERLPLGPGWISWSVVPRLAVSGQAVVGTRRLDLSGAAGYQDHNWGRWHWGEDLGWEFSALLAPASGPAFVFTRTSDRAHRRHGRPSLLVCAGGRSVTFSGQSVRVEFDGRLDTRLRRLPGALAALHGDRVAPALPARMRVTAEDGRGRAAVEFAGTAAVQVIAGDSVREGYGFLHEVVGRFRSEGVVGGVSVGAEGLGVMEFVD